MDKKKEIIIKAAEMFSQKGYYGVGLQELMDLCKVPKGSFYYYFPKGKIDLLNQVLDYCYEDMEKGILTKYFVEDSLEDCFNAMVEGLYSALNKKHCFDSLTLSMIGIESVYLDSSINEKCKTIYVKWKKLYEDLFTRFGYSIEDANQKSQSIFALIHGSLISSWIKNNPEDMLLAKQSISRIIND